MNEPTEWRRARALDSREGDLSTGEYAEMQTEKGEIMSHINTSFEERKRIMDEIKCSKCGKQGAEICDDCFEKSMWLIETPAVIKSRENILQVIEYLMQNNIRFYLDNNLITKHAVFTFHRPHLDRVEFHFPTLVEVKKHKDSRNFDVGFIRLHLEKSEKIDNANYRGTMRYGRTKW